MRSRFTRALLLVIAVFGLSAAAWGIRLGYTDPVPTRDIEVTYEIPEMFTGENFTVRAMGPGLVEVRVADSTGSATLSVPDDLSIIDRVQVFHNPPFDGTGYFCAIGFTEIDASQTRVDFEVSDDFACEDE